MSAVLRHYLREPFCQSLPRAWRRVEDIFHALYHVGLFQPVPLVVVAKSNRRLSGCPYPYKPIGIVLGISTHIVVYQIAVGMPSV